MGWTTAPPGDGWHCCQPPTEMFKLEKTNCFSGSSMRWIARSTASALLRTWRSFWRKCFFFLHLRASSFALVFLRLMG